MRRSMLAAVVVTAACSSDHIGTGPVASRLAFTVQPSAATAGVVIAPSVQVTAQDDGGAVVTSFTGTITISLATNPGLATLSGTLSKTAVAGVATFSDLRLNHTGSGYAFAAASGALTAATSGVFTIAPAPPAQLAFLVQPTDAAAGAAVAPAVQVQARDSLGNLTPVFTGSVTLAIGTNPSGGTLSGSVASATAGVATFPGLSVDKVGSGYTLVATSGTLTAATSQAFSITSGAPSRLAFTVQPSGPSATQAGAAIAPPVQVVIEDAAGNVVTSATNTVVMAIGTNPSGGALSGTTSVSAVSGVATFSNLKIDKAGTGYTLLATSAGLTPATSTPFDITAGAADHLGFVVQPADAAAGATIAPGVSVDVEDAFGNRVTSSTASVTVAIQDNPNSGVLSGTATVAAVAGLATFATLSINKSGTGYTLTASASGLAAALSNDFNIIPGAAARVSFFVEPTNTAAGATITPGVQVEILDGFGNRVAAATNTVTIGFAANPGPGTLSGTLSRAAVAGVATFGDLNINKVASGYTLRASASGLALDTSATFSVAAGSGTQLVFTSQPVTAQATTNVGPVTVSARDAQGNTATGFTGMVSLAIGSNPGNGTLSGALSVAAVAGVATFSTLAIDKAGTGYTLVANAGGLPQATSSSFSVTTGAATTLAFLTQPSDGSGGAPLGQVQVEIRDAGGNRVTTASNSIGLAIGTNPGGGTLSGTTSQAASNGVASFNTLAIDSAGVGYTLNASATGLAGAASTTFTIAVGQAAKVGFLVPPSNTATAQPITPDIQVEIRDLGGNRVTSSAATVSLTIGTNPPGTGSLSGTTSVAATGGLATFPGLSINTTGSGYTLVAAAPSLTSATSPPFDITTGSATKVVFIVQPASTTGGTALNPAVQVEIEDAGGNLVSTATNSVTLALGNNPKSGLLLGTKTVAAVAGIATFTDVSIDSAATGYTLSASASGLTAATSSAFDITVGLPAKLGFHVPPANASGGATIAPAVQVEIQDAGGNRVTSAGTTVTLSIATNPKAGTLSGTTIVGASSGIAMFGTLSIDSAASGYRLGATASGLAGVTSAPFNITVGPAARLGFFVAPSDVTAGQAITPAVQVEIRDAGGNRVTTAANTVAVAIGTNPGGGTLSGSAPRAAASGVATFSGLSIQKSGVGYTLLASSSGLTAATSGGFTVTADGVSATLSTLARTADTVGQCAVSCSPTFQTSTVTVTVQDQFGNRVAGAPVVVSATGAGNVFSPSGSGTTDATGVFTATYNAAVAENKTVSATAGGVAITTTAGVAVMPVLVGAGDIADCNSIRDDATANQLDSIPGTVFADGDNAYPNGRAADFTNCYDPTWGRHRARTKPVVGNHEYDSSATAAPYFAYFGAAIADPLGNGFGYYSFDLGAWHVVVLNSDSGVTSASSNQLAWLQSDLVGRTNQCILALWHRPLFTSGSSGGASAKVGRLWQVLENAGAEVVVNGHDHIYERFAPQDSLGNATSAGIREFIVGTGGGETHGNFPNTPPNVEASDAANFSRGVLRLTLYPNAYRWQFLPAQGFGTYSDSGSANCH